MKKNRNSVDSFDLQGNKKHLDVRIGRTERIREDCSMGEPDRGRKKDTSF